MPPPPKNDLGLMIKLNLGREKSGNFKLSRKWQPCLLLKTMKNLNEVGANRYAQDK